MFSVKPHIAQPAGNRGNSIKIMIIFHLSGWFSRSSSSLSDPFSTSKPKYSFYSLPLEFCLLLSNKRQNSWTGRANILFGNSQDPRARDLKNSRKYGSGLSCRWALFTAWAFKIQAASYFPQSWVQKNSLIFYLAKFLVFMRTRFNIDPYSPLKPTKVSFIFTESKIFQLSITWRTLSSELGLKVGFKELRLEPKFLNRGLRKV